MSPLQSIGVLIPLIILRKIQLLQNNAYQYYFVYTIKRYFEVPRSRAELRPHIPIIIMSLLTLGTSVIDNHACRPTRHSNTLAIHFNDALHQNMFPLKIFSILQHGCFLIPYTMKIDCHLNAAFLFKISSSISKLGIRKPPPLFE